LATDFFVVEGIPYGLILNLIKIIIIQPFGLQQDTVSLFPDIQVCREKGVELLGGGVSCHQQFFEELAMKKVNKSICSLKAVMTLEDTDIKLVLLRYSQGMKKLIFLWRLINPDYLNEAADEMEKALIKALRRIVAPNGTNCGDFQINQMCLPLSMRGLGIQKPTDISKFAYIGSKISTSAAQNAMFQSIPTQISASTESLCVRFLSYFSPDTFITLQDITSPHNNKQHQLANWYNKEKHERMIIDWCEEHKNEDLFHERWVILKSIGSLDSQWLDALPNHRLDQTMSNRQFIAALQFRYGIPMLASSDCLNCNEAGDVYGFHAARCRGNHSRHQVLVKALTAVYNMANLKAQMDAKVSCLDENSFGNLRPADILADGEGNNGSQDCVDVTIVSNMCKSVSRPLIPGKAALVAEKRSVTNI
jgi:hypothetical protein